MGTRLEAYSSERGEDFGFKGSGIPPPRVPGGLLHAGKLRFIAPEDSCSRPTWCLVVWHGSSLTIQRLVCKCPEAAGLFGALMMIVMMALVLNKGAGGAVAGGGVVVGGGGAVLVSMGMEWMWWWSGGGDEDVAFRKGLGGKPGNH